MIRSLPLALLLLSPVLCQDPVEPPPPPPRSAQVAKQAPVVITVDFSGGRLGEFVDLLRHLDGKANIIVAADAVNAVLPPLHLKDAGIEQALDVACSVAESEWLIHPKEFRGPGLPVYSIVVSPRGPSPASTVPKQRTQVFSLVQLTEGHERGIGVKVETVLSAIEAATEAGLAAMRYHRESGLLIVRGGSEQLGLVREVLSELEGDVKRKRSEAAAKGKGEAPAKAADAAK